MIILPTCWRVTSLICTSSNRVEVVTLLSPGDSPATYQVTDAQISRVMRARVYFRTGVPFEHGRWFETLEASAGPAIVDLREGIALRHMEHDHDHGEAADAGTEQPDPSPPDTHLEAAAADPHIWVAPGLLKIQALAIADALTDVDPEGHDSYHRRYEELVAELQALQDRIHSRLHGFEGRAFYVFHPAWGYFAEEFGLHQKAIEIEGKDPSDHDLTVIQAQMRADGAGVIFVQPQIGSRAVEAVGAATGAEVRLLDPLVRDVITNLEQVAEAIAGAFR